MVSGTGLTGHSGHRPVDGRRLGRPGVQHGGLRLSALPATEHIIPYGDSGGSLADLVHHPGGVVPQILWTG